MSEDQLARNKQLLTLKGVITEEEPELQVDPTLVLDAHQRRKDAQGESELDVWEKRLLQILIARLER